MPAYKTYIASALEAGCPKDQIRNLLRADVVLQPRQLEASALARKCDAEDGPTELGYGGARSGGKSHWLITQIGVDDCLRYPTLKCLILRKVGKSLKEGVRDLLARTLHRLEHRYLPSQSTIFFENGSKIVLGHFQKESDIDTYLGLEYDVIGVEEATTLSLSKYEAIRTCCRTSKPGWRPRVYSTTNPGNIGHAWYKALFIDPARRSEQTDTCFVPATVDDNRFINAEYRAQLEKLKGWQLQAWRYGDWDIAAGQYFVNFRREIDGQPHHVLPVHSVEPGINWQYWCSLDYGFAHYTVCYLFGKDGDGNLYCLDEHAERQWVVRRHADAIHAMLARHGLTIERLERFVAGGDVFNRGRDGLTVAGQYEECGIRLTSANDDRIQGASEILNRFGEIREERQEGEETIPPNLFILERCVRLITCIPTLERDPHCPERVRKVDCDENGVGGDDFYDAFRYGVMADYAAPRPHIEAPVSTEMFTSVAVAHPPFPLRGLPEPGGGGAGLRFRI